MLRLVEGRRANFEIGFLPKKGGYRLVHTFRINRCNLGALFSWRNSPQTVTSNKLDIRIFRFNYLKFSPVGNGDKLHFVCD